jgi:L-rhamnose-H+ transport protein
MLTTFQECDMSGIMALREQYKDGFEKKHGVKLGFMSAFLSASAAMLKEFPVVNATIEGGDVVYRNYVDISVAVSSPRGLVVPVLRNVERMSYLDIEKRLGELAANEAGRWTLLGVAISLLGIAFSGAAGLGKERDLSDEKKRETVKEFALGKGLVIAGACGLLSACMSFAFRAGAPVIETAVARGTDSLWAALPLLVVVLLGGFATNFVWCLILNFRNRSFGEYAGRAADRSRAPVLANMGFCALAGVAWYLQFFFYSMGESRMGAGLKFSSWTLHMATIIIFSTIWGILLLEWRGVSAGTRRWVAAGLAVLILATMIVGYGNLLGGTRGH